MAAGGIRSILGKVADDDARRARLIFSAMAPRSPQPQTSRVRGNVLEYEIVQEQAAALGRLGGALEAAQTGLAAFDATQQGSSVDNASRSSRKAARTELPGGRWLCASVLHRPKGGLRASRPRDRHPRVPRARRGSQPHGLVPQRPLTSRPLAGAPILPTRQAFIHRYGGIFCSHGAGHAAVDP